MFSRLHARIGAVHLPRPRTGKGCKHILCRIKVDLGAHQAVQTDRLPALIEENGASHNRIALCVDIIMKFQNKIIGMVAQPYAETLCLPPLVVSSREISVFCPRRLFCDLIAFISEIRSGTAVRVHDLHKRFADVSFSVGGHLKPHILQRKRLILLT